MVWVLYGFMCGVCVGVVYVCVVYVWRECRVEIIKSSCGCSETQQEGGFQ